MSRLRLDPPVASHPAALLTGGGSRRPSLGPTAGFVVAAVALASLYLAAGAPTPLLVVLQRQWVFPTWVLTVAFAAYAVGLLAALLVVGSLSDYVGRKPVLLASLVVELLAMLIFVFAPTIGWVVAARTIQGIATGAATSAFTASLVELAPVPRAKLGPIIGSIAPAGGLGVGALLTGIVVQHSSASARVLVFVCLAAVMASALAVLPFTPETTPRRAGAVRSLVPRVSVPPAAGGEFAAAVPVLVAAWMLAGLFLGLVPTVLRDIFGRDGGLLDGVTVFLEPGAAAVTGVVLGRWTGRRVLLTGSVTTFLGMAVVIAGVLDVSLPLLWVGALVGGVGFGASFSGSLRVISPLAAARQRAGLFAAIYLVSYLAFGVPAVVAGLLRGPFGLLPTVVAYAAVVVIVAVVGLLVQARLAARPRASAVAGPPLVADGVAELDPRLHVHLGEDGTEVGADGAGGHSEPGGDGSVGVPVTDEVRDRERTVGERGPAEGRTRLGPRPVPGPDTRAAQDSLHPGDRGPGVEALEDHQRLVE